MWKGGGRDSVFPCLSRCKKIKKAAFFATKGGNTKDDTFVDMEVLSGAKPIDILEISGDLIKNGEYVNKTNKFVDEIMAKR